MNDPLAQLEALARDPRLRVAPEQRPAIVAEILHHLMWPYFLNRTPEMREKFSEANYRAFMRALEGFCLRDYIEHPEPRLTIDFIKGLHRQFYANAASMPVKAVDGSMTTMVPGEFKATRVFIRRKSLPGKWFDSAPPEEVEHHVAILLQSIEDEQTPIMERYIRLIVDLIHIHPFADGNGKVAMTLGDLFLLKRGLRPPLYTRYKSLHEMRVYGIYDEYFLDPKHDIAMCYPLVIEAYAEAAGNNQDPPCRGMLAPGDMPVAYWQARHLLFSRWDNGIQTDREGLFSVKPEILALQLADALNSSVVLDAFCGIGGFTIALARSGKRVISVDIDRARLEMARHNARLYEVEEKIEFVHGDAINLISKHEYDVAIFDPPWGGQGYRGKTRFGWGDFQVNPYPLLREVITRGKNAILIAPFNFDLDLLPSVGAAFRVQEAAHQGNLFYFEISFVASFPKVGAGETRV